MKLKRTFCLIVALCLMLGAFSMPAAAADVTRSYERETQLAYALEALGLFQGYSGTNLGLEDAPTRTQALVMMLRLMGLEEAALAEGGAHPFEDMGGMAWAEPYVGYAYQHGLAKGISDTQFGGKEPASAGTYLTFMLRALGYQEGENADFTWNYPTKLALILGLLPAKVDTRNFLRADIVTISYAALGVRCKGSGVTLAQDLTARGVLTRDALDAYYDPAAAQTGKLASPYAENAAAYYCRYRLPLGIDISGQTIMYKESVILIGDACYENYGFFADGPNRCAEQIRNGAQAVAGSARVFAVGAPNRLGAMLSDADFARLTSSEKTEAQAIDYLYEQAGEQVIGVDALKALRLHNSEYLYFRSDHHWTALGAYYAYTAWAEAAGFDPVPLSRFDVQTRGGLLGWFYEFCNCPYAMRMNPDTVTAYIPRSDLSVEYVDASGTKTDDKIVYDYNNYAAFLLGDHQLVTITNNDIQDDSACVLVKDSYGNPFAVYLTQHYHTVYVIDYRHYQNMFGFLTFSRFAAEKGVQDFIVLLPMTLQSGATADMLSRYCR